MIIIINIEERVRASEWVRKMIVRLWATHIPIYIHTQNQVCEWVERERERESILNWIIYYKMDLKRWKLWQEWAQLGTARTKWEWLRGRGLGLCTVDGLCIRTVTVLSFLSPTSPPYRKPPNYLSPSSSSTSSSSASPFPLTLLLLPLPSHPLLLFTVNVSFFKTLFVREAAAAIRVNFLQSSTTLQ